MSADRRELLVDLLKRKEGEGEAQPDSTRSAEARIAAEDAPCNRSEPFVALLPS